MRLLPLALLALVACGPSRDPSFNRIVQFSAVKKIQASANFIYTFESTGLERVPTTGGSLETMFSDDGVNDFSVIPSGAYVATNNGLVLVDLSTHGHQTLFAEKTVAVAADQFGVTFLTCNALNHAALDGSQRISTPLDSCNGDSKLAIDSSTAYGSNADGDWFASRSGGPISIFGNTPCFRVVAGGGWMYCGSAGLKRINPLTQDVETVVDGDVHDFTLSAESIYLSVGTDLDSMPRGGGNLYVLGTLADISAVDVDDKLVYFVNTDSNLGLLLSTAL
jgi:hypothetical protein